MPAAYSLCYAYGMRASRRQQQACVGKAAARGMCTFVAMVIGDLIEVTAPNGFRWPLVADAPGASCISADPRAPGRPWATAVALSSHT